MGGPTSDIRNYRAFFVKWQRRTWVDQFVVCLTQGRTYLGCRSRCGRLVAAANGRYTGDRRRAAAGLAGGAPN
jgi:hypothetical protein